MDWVDFIRRAVEVSGILLFPGFAGKMCTFGKKISISKKTAKTLKKKSISDTLKK